MSSRTPKLRIIAGPNGSGKSTLIKELIPKFNFGHYINADDIETELKATGSFNFNKFNEIVNYSSLNSFLKKSGLVQKLPKNFSFKVEDNFFICSKKFVNSYVALIIAEYLRHLFLKSKQTFSFETVMSDTRKIDLMRKATNQGFRIYVYYICTSSPAINVQRVKQRVQLNGHPVPPKKIRDRYYKSLDNLYSALKLANRGYVFDNSSKRYIRIAETIDSKTIRYTQKWIPRWFQKVIEEKKLN